jgi:hypothetical protein
MRSCPRPHLHPHPILTRALTRASSSRFSERSISVPDSALDRVAKANQFWDVSQSESTYLQFRQWLQSGSKDGAAANTGDAVDDTTSAVGTTGAIVLVVAVSVFAVVGIIVAGERYKRKQGMSINEVALSSVASSRHLKPSGMSASTTHSASGLARRVSNGVASTIVDIV